VGAASAATANTVGYGGRHGILVCSLLAMLPECFANKQTRTDRDVGEISVYCCRAVIGGLFIGSKAQRSEP